MTDEQIEMLRHLIKQEIDAAEYCVRMCRKYKNRIFHYVED